MGGVRQQTTSSPINWNLTLFAYVKRRGKDVVSPSLLCCQEQVVGTTSEALRPGSYGTSSSTLPPAPSFGLCKPSYQELTHLRSNSFLLWLSFQTNLRPALSHRTTPAVLLQLQKAGKVNWPLLSVDSPTLSRIQANIKVKNLAKRRFY